MMMIMKMKLDYQKYEHDLDDRMGTFMVDRRPCTEKDAQMKSAERWSRLRSSKKNREEEDEDEDEDEDEEEEDEEPMDRDKLGIILYARLACISHLCPDAGYSNSGLESEKQLDIELDRHGYGDYYGDESNIQRVKNVSTYEKARDKERKAARTDWAKSLRLREAMSHIKEHLEQKDDLIARRYGVLRRRIEWVLCWRVD